MSIKNLISETFRAWLDILRDSEHSTKREKIMPRKNKNNRRTAAEIVATFTREDIVATIAERNALASQVLKVTQVLEGMKAAGMAEEAIQTVRETLDQGAMMRVSYLELKVKRAAMAITRMQGYKHWRNIVETNLEYIPTVSEKSVVTLSTL